MGQRGLNAPLPVLCCARYRSGETHATGRAGQTHTHPWIDGVDNHRGVVEPARTSLPHLVTGYAPEQADCACRRSTQAKLVCYDSGKDGYVRSDIILFRHTIEI